jgi:hypothetical protein
MSYLSRNSWKNYLNVNKLGSKNTIEYSTSYLQSVCGRPETNLLPIVNSNNSSYHTSFVRLLTNLYQKMTLSISQFLLRL